MSDNSDSAGSGIVKTAEEYGMHAVFGGGSGPGRTLSVIDQITDAQRKRDEDMYASRADGESSGSNAGPIVVAFGLAAVALYACSGSNRPDPQHFTATEMIERQAKKSGVAAPTKTESNDVVVAETAKPAFDEKRLIVTVDQLNVRDCPGTSCTVQEIIKRRADILQTGPAMIGLDGKNWLPIAGHFKNGQATTLYVVAQTPAGADTAVSIFDYNEPEPVAAKPKATQQRRGPPQPK